MDSPNDPPPPTDAAESPPLGFGRVEDLEIYDENREAFVPHPTVTCSICNLYIGTPEVIEQHERSHFAVIEELPDYSDVYARIAEKIRKRRDDRLQEEWKEPRDEWKERLLALFLKDPSDFKEQFPDMVISIELDGKSIDVRSFDALIKDSTHPDDSCNHIVSSGHQITEAGPLKPEDIYKFCELCNKGYVSEEDLRMHLKNFHKIP